MLAMRFVEFLPTVLFEIWVKRFPLFQNIKKHLPKERSADDWTSSLSEKYVVSRGYRDYSPESLRGHSTSSLMDRYTIGKMPGPTSQWFSIDPIEPPKIRKSVFKRQEEGSHQIPFLSAKSLFTLVSSVFYKSGKSGKLRQSYSNLFYKDIMSLAPKELVSLGKDVFSYLWKVPNFKGTFSFGGSKFSKGKFLNDIDFLRNSLLERSLIPVKVMVRVLMGIGPNSGL
jgi:hypothetical protein